MLPSPACPHRRRGAPPGWTAGNWLDWCDVMRRRSSAVWGITAASLAYATLRYNVFKGVAWSDWPVFVLNKAIALSSLLLLVAWILRNRRPAEASGAPLLAAASMLALAHAGLSLIVLTPAYFPAFFEESRLSWQAGVALALGVATAIRLSVVARPGHAHLSRLRGLGLIACAAGCHAALFGYSSWFTPTAWPGSLPPITLVSFAAGLIGAFAAFNERLSEQDRS